MKNTLITAMIIAALVGLLIYQFAMLDMQQDKYNIAMQNNKAYASQIDELNNEKKAFLLTIDQLCYMNDKSINELDSMRRELKIKDKQIMQMSKIKEKIYITDTLKLIDTFFKEPNFRLDTCLGDKWYTNCLHLAYPNQISSELNVNTDLNCFIYTKRETINPPCKTWIGRLFQKKHTVINVDVVENNPHSNIKETKFIKILDK